MTIFLAGTTEQSHKQSDFGKLFLAKSLANETQLTDLQQRLALLNPAAQQLRVLNGETDGQALFGTGLFSLDLKTPDVLSWLKQSAYSGTARQAASSPDTFRYQPIAANALKQIPTKKQKIVQQDINRHDDHIRAFCFTFDTPIEPELFDQWLSLLMSFKGPDILRVKGMLNLKHRSGPMVIHGVQHIFHPPIELAEWPSEDRRTRIIFITRDVDRSVIERTFNGFISPNMS